MNLIFDYDGTCHDTIGVYGEAVRESVLWLKEMGYTPSRPTDNISLSRYLGMKTSDMWSDFLPGAPSHITEQAALIVGKSLVYATQNHKARLYNGIEELFKTLIEKGHVLLILSNCTNSYRDAHIKAFQLERYISKFYSSEEYDGIPKEDIFKIIREEFHGEYCIIGDRYGDMKAGYINGITTIACHYGYGTPEELCDADYHVASVSELTELLTGF